MRCFVFLLVICSACGSPGKKRNNAQEKHQDIQVLNDSLEKHVQDSLHEKFLNKIAEPQLKTIQKNAYRYVYGRPFSNVLYYYTVIEGANDTSLVTKVVAGLYRLGEDSSKVFEYDNIYVKTDTVLFSATQELTPEQYSEFLKILNGSYYWAMDEDKLKGFSCNADNLYLESSTGYDKKFQYHFVSINGPRKGSFKNGCLYLAQLSILKQSGDAVKYLKQR